MKLRKTSCALLAAAAAFTFSSCAENNSISSDVSAPDSTVSDAYSSEENISESSTVSSSDSTESRTTGNDKYVGVKPEFASLSDIKAGIPDALALSPENIILPDNVSVDFDSVRKITATEYVPLTDDIIKKLASDFFGEEYDDKYITDMGEVLGVQDPYGAPHYDYVDDDHSNRVSLYYDTGIGVFTDCTDYIHFLPSSTFKTSYELDGKKLPTDSCPLWDSPYTIKQAVEYASDYIDKYLSESGADSFEARPIKAEVYELSGFDKATEKLGGDETVNLINIRFAAYYHDVPMMYNDTVSNTENRTETLAVPIEQISVTMYKPDKIGTLSISNINNIKDSGEEYDSLVTLESAVKLASAYLAGNYTFAAEEISLEYAYKSDKNSEDRPVEPYWIFRTVPVKHIPDDSYPCRCIFVNAVDGEVSSYISELDNVEFF